MVERQGEFVVFVLDLEFGTITQDVICRGSRVRLDDGVASQRVLHNGCPKGERERECECSSAW